MQDVLCLRQHPPLRFASYGFSLSAAQNIKEKRGMMESRGKKQRDPLDEAFESEWGEDGDDSDGLEGDGGFLDSQFSGDIGSGDIEMGAGADAKGTKEVIL